MTIVSAQNDNGFYLNRKPRKSNQLHSNLKLTSKTRRPTGIGHNFLKNIINKPEEFSDLLMIFYETGMHPLFMGKPEQTQNKMLLC